MDDTVKKITAERIAKKEALVKAWVAATGVPPQEAILIEHKTDPLGLKWQYSVVAKHDEWKKMEVQARVEAEVNKRMHAHHYKLKRALELLEFGDIPGVEKTIKSILEG